MKHYRDQTLAKSEQIKQSINYSISICSVCKHFICINVCLNLYANKIFRHKLPMDDLKTQVLVPDLFTTRSR